MRSIITVLIISFASLTSKCQNAPVADIPNNENKILIDSLMKVTRYKDYFQAYCDRQIDNAAKLNNWDEDIIRKKKLAVSFNDFKAYTIYNWFSSLQKEDLQILISLFQKMNTGKYSTFLVTHSGIQSNLELFVKQYLK